MLDGVIGAASLVLALVALLALGLFARPFWFIKRRWQAALIGVAAVLGLALLEAIPPSRPASIAPAAWARRVSDCAFVHAERLCPTSDVQSAQAAGAVAEWAKAQAAQRQAAAQAASHPVQRTPPPPQDNDRALADRDGVVRKIVEGSLTPYNRNDDPDIFRTWGTAGVARIEKLRKAAAEAVAGNQQCDQVVSDQLADRRSRAPSRPVVFVDCQNQVRFFVSEQDLARGVQSEADHQREVLAQPFFMTCVNHVQGMLRYPTTFNLHYGRSVTVDDAGNYGVVIDFDAMNGFGARLPQRAACMSTPTGGMRIRIGVPR